MSQLATKLTSDGPPSVAGVGSGGQDKADILVRGIKAWKAGDYPRAYEMFTQSAAQNNPEGKVVVFPMARAGWLVASLTAMGFPKIQPPPSCLPNRRKMKEAPWPR